MGNPLLQGGGSKENIVLDGLLKRAVVNARRGSNPARDAHTTKQRCLRAEIFALPSAAAIQSVSLNLCALASLREIFPLVKTQEHNQFERLPRRDPFQVVRLGLPCY
jgi:hypothetical protein